MNASVGDQQEGFYYAVQLVRKLSLKAAEDTPNLLTSSVLLFQVELLPCQVSHPNTC